MKKLLKIFAIIFVVFILLLIIAVILVKIFFPPEKVKALLITQMEENLKREVEIKDLSIGIFKGVSVEGLKVSEFPTFKQGTFVSSEGFLVRYKLLPLLKKQLVISKVALEEPRINIERNSDGSFNFSDLIQEAPPEEKEVVVEEKKEKGPGFNFLVSRAEIKDGEVKFTDYSPEAMSARIYDINLDVSGISLVTPMDIILSANLEHKDLSGGIAFDGKLDFEKGVLRIDRLSPYYSDMSFDISGIVENFKERPKINLTLQDRKIVLDNLSKIFPMPKGLELRGAPKFKIDVSGSIDDLLIKTDFNIDDVEIKFQDAFHKESGKKLALKFEAELKDTDRLKLKWSSLSLGNYMLSASGEVEGLKNPPPFVNITVQTDGLEMGELAGFSSSLKDMKLSGQLGLACNIKGKPPENIHFAGEASIDSMYLLMDKQELKNIKAQKIEFSDAALSVPRLRGIWNGANFSLSCQVKEYSMKKFTSPRVSFDFRLSSLNVNEVLSRLPSPEEGAKTKRPSSKAAPTPPIVKDIIRGIKVNGGLKIDKITYEDSVLSNAEAKINMRQGKLEIKPFSVEGYEGTLSGEIGANLTVLDDIKFTTTINLKNLNLNPAVMDIHPQRMAKIFGKASFGTTMYGESKKMPDSLEGSGYLKIEKGKIESGVPLLGKLMGLMGKPQIQTIIFEELKGHYKVKDKKITTNDLQMIGDDLSFDANGWADMDMNLSFDVIARVSDKLISDSIKQHVVKDEEGRSILYLKVKGKVNKPSVSVDIKKTVSEQAKKKAKGKVLDRVLGEDKGDMRDKLEKGLDKIFDFK